jgi:hypothetical protein
MEQVYLTEEEFKALPTFNENDPPPPVGSPPWKSPSDGFKTTNGAHWFLCEWEHTGVNARFVSRPITIVPVKERLARALEAARKAEEAAALETVEQKAMAELAPQLMAELMQAYIKQRSLNDRVKLRRRMKALLDLFRVDTEYPEIPALNPDQDTLRPQRGRPRVPQGGYVGVAAPAFQGVPAVAEAGPRPQGNEELRRAIERQVQQELGREGGPVGMLPAPGAPAAAADLGEEIEEETQQV